MKRILFISPRLGQGGAERQIVTVALMMKHRGYDVEMLCYSYGDFYEVFLREAGIPVYWRQHNYLMRLISCTWFIQRGHYDVVVSFLPTPSLLNCFAAFLRKRWRVITGERSSVITAPQSTRQKIDAWLHRYCDAIVCNSDNARRLWEIHYPQFADRLTTIYNCVKLDKITVKYRPRRDGKVHICVAATVYDMKNPTGVVTALLLMNEEERKRFVIEWYGKAEAQIGDRRVYDLTRQQIADNYLNESFQLFDATKDISNRMMESDCVALFSQVEGLPNAICEGMMIGKPIVMTRVSDYATLVEEEINGYLCDWDRPESIKEAILKVASLSENDLKRMGNQSLKKAESLFAEDIIAQKWIQLF